MADAPERQLNFKGRCPDCGSREVRMPRVLPTVGDDFDWEVRDFDSFRRFMLEELAARFPERKRWTPADLEVVLVEVFAGMLDQLSDMVDRVDAETSLETARRPESVRRLLKLIGYDAVVREGLVDDPPENPSPRTAEEKLHIQWASNPRQMDRARREGPRNIRVNRRMVTLSDYADALEEHPLVLRASSFSRWSGSWETIHVAIIGFNDYLLDQEKIELSDSVKDKVNKFHQEKGMFAPFREETTPPTIRTVLKPFVTDYRMLGREVVLIDGLPTGIQMSISIRVASNYFQSEIRRAVEQAMGTGSGGFFQPGRLAFGEDIYAGDVFQHLMSLEGVENVCLNRFKRFGDQYPDRSAEGRVHLKGLEVAVCDNDPEKPERGFFYLALHGGRKG